MTYSDPEMAIRSLSYTTNVTLPIVFLSICVCDQKVPNQDISKILVTYLSYSLLPPPPHSEN